MQNPLKAKLRESMSCIQTVLTGLTRYYKQIGQ